MRVDSFRKSRRVRNLGRIGNREPASRGGESGYSGPMIEIALAAVLSAWLVSASIGALGVIVFFRQMRWHRGRVFALPSSAPKVALVVPIKGCEPHTRDCLTSILKQDYPDYRLVCVVEAASDPAYQLAASLQRGTDAPVSVVVAGEAQSRGQKVHNLLRGLQALEPRDEIVCFLDADAALNATDVRTMVAELCVWDEPVLLGAYRWMFPAAPGIAPIATATADFIVATSAKSPMWDLAWGGFMGLKRETLSRIDLERVWGGSLSDDVPLSRALRAAGVNVKTMPNLVVPSPCTFSVAQMCNFAIRQYFMLRVYAPRHWVAGCFAFTVYFLGLAASVISFANPSGTLPFMLAIACWLMSSAGAMLRAVLAIPFMPRPLVGKFIWICALDLFLPVVPALVHAVGLAGSLKRRRVTWAGITYDVSRGKVVRVERAKTAPANVAVS